MKHEPDKYYKCVKLPLKSIIRRDSDIIHITNAVNKGSKIVTYALQFIKLYSLKYYEKYNELPNINTNFIRCSLRVVCKSSGKSIKDDELLNKMKKFYSNEFKNLKIKKFKFKRKFKK